MPKARLSAVLKVYHQAAGGADQPTGSEAAFSRWLDTDEQPFTRRSSVAGEWQPLPCGWLDHASNLLLVNEEGRARQVQPTAAERQALSEKVIKVGVCFNGVVVPLALARPGEAACFEPAAPLGAYRIHCAAGPARYTLTLTPA